ncbi:hypothetical protein F9K50_00295 [bacterium]|nr:MAG: hypothetical protein F9K50_00295 [bacterium]
MIFKNTAILLAFTAMSMAVTVHATDLSLTKAALDSQGRALIEAAPGTEFFYEIFVRDSKESVEGINVFLTDTLPEEIQVLTVTADRGLCAIQDQIVTCDFGTVADGEAIRVLITAKVRESAALGAAILNNATLTADNEVQPSNNEAGAQFTVGTDTSTELTTSSGGCSLTPSQQKTLLWKTFQRGLAD